MTPTTPTNDTFPKTDHAAEQRDQMQGERQLDASDQARAVIRRITTRVRMPNPALIRRQPQASRNELATAIAGSGLASPSLGFPAPPREAQAPEPFEEASGPSGDRENDPYHPDDDPRYGTGWQIRGGRRTWCGPGVPDCRKCGTAMTRTADTATNQPIFLCLQCGHKEPGHPEPPLLQVLREVRGGG